MLNLVFFVYWRQNIQSIRPKRSTFNEFANFNIQAGKFDLALKKIWDEEENQFVYLKTENLVKTKPSRKCKVKYEIERKENVAYRHRTWFTLHWIEIREASQQK